jgi:putative transposase
MANTYSQLYIHIVFAVKGRERIIPKIHKEELQKYTTGIITNREHKLLAINFMPDHVHILIGYQPSQPLPDLVRDIKAITSKQINERSWIKGRFEWQEGYGAFSYSKSQIDEVVYYIQNQEKHHEKTSFKEEYLMTLKKYDIEYNEAYLFEFIE